MENKIDKINLTIDRSGKFIKKKEMKGDWFYLLFLAL